MLEIYRVYAHYQRRPARRPKLLYLGPDLKVANGVFGVEVQAMRTGRRPRGRAVIFRNWTEVRGERIGAR